MPSSSLQHSPPASAPPNKGCDLVFNQSTLHTVFSRQFVDDLFDGDISDVDTQSGDEDEDKDKWLPPPNKNVKRVTSEHPIYRPLPQLTDYNTHSRLSSEGARATGNPAPYGQGMHLYNPYQSIWNFTYDPSTYCDP
jgi:hypothetical protein